MTAAELLSHGQRTPRWHVGAAGAVVAVVAGVVLWWLLSAGGSGTASGALVLPPGARQVFGVPNRPGRPVDFAGVVVNTSTRSITVDRARLIPFTGHPAPRLVGVSIEPHGRDYYSGRTWPVTEVANQQLPAPVPPGRSVVLFAVTGERVGVDYLTLGVRLYYRQGHHMRFVDVFVGGVDCVRSHARGPACGPEDDLVLNEVNKRSRA